MNESSFGPVPEVPDGETKRWGTWDDSVIRGLYVPIAIVCFGILFTFYSVGIYSPNFHGRRAAAEYVLVTVMFRVGLLIWTAWVAARIMEISLGRIVPAVLKLPAIAISPGIAVGTLLIAAGMLRLSVDGGFTDYLSRPSLGSIAAGAISLVTVFALFYALFDLPQDIGTWRFILLAWAIQFFVAGFITHMIVDPPARGPRYVPPRNPLHFSFGS